MKRVGDLAFKAAAAGLGVATIYLAATFSVNLYRGISWHSAQTRMFYIRSVSLNFLKEFREADDKPHFIKFMEKKMDKEKSEE